MSWIKSILTATCGYCLLMAMAQADERSAASPLYQCPAFLQLETDSYPLEVEHVYDGPIEEQFILKPEPVVDNDSRELSWGYGEASLDRPFYIKCHYKGTGHYLVLEAKGARHCTFTKQTWTRCE